MISQEQAKRRAFIMDRASKMQKAKELYSFHWANFEKIFKMIQEGRTGEDEWRADLPDTWAFATIKTAQSAFVDSKVIPTIIRHEDDPSSKATDLKDLYVDVAEKGNLDQELYFTRLDTFKLGNGFTKTIYIKDSRKVWNIERFDPKTNEFKWKEKTINDFDDPKTIRVSPYLILKDDLARANWNTVRDLIELEVMGRDDAERLYPDINFDSDVPATTYLLQTLKATASVKISDTNPGAGIRGTEFQNINYTFFSPGFDWSNEVVEILHYWNRVQDTYEILINGFPAKVKTKKNPSPIPYIHKQIPYTHYMYSPYGGDEAWGAGIIEIGRAEIKALKLHREMMSDRQKVSLFSPAFSDINDEIDQKVMKLKPLSIIRTKGGVPKQYQIPGITTADLALQDRYESSYKRATGIDERILGVEAQGSRMTATEVSFLREAALKRLREFAFLYKNALLQGEIRFKLSLFKQYYSSPIAREPKVKSDKGVRNLINQFKEFKVRIGNVYVNKEVGPNFFQGEVDVDLDLQLLLPMTQAQMVTMWSQILRDSVPFVQAGIIDISIKKVFENYVEALGTSYNALKEDKVANAVDMADAEHALFADSNSSANMKDVLPKGTQPPFLTEEHIMRHQELLDADIAIGDQERLRLSQHIKQDIENLKTQQVQTQGQGSGLAGLNPQTVQSVGGLSQAPQLNLTAPTAPAATL